MAKLCAVTSGPGVSTGSCFRAPRRGAGEPSGWEAAQGMSAAVGQVPRAPRVPMASVYPPLGQALQPPAETRPGLLELQMHAEPEVP